MAIEIAIYTKRYRDFMEGNRNAVSTFRTAARIHVPLVVVAELRAGFAVGERVMNHLRPSAAPLLASTRHP